MKSVKDSTFKYNFTYSKPNDSTLILNGGNYKHKFSIRFIKFDESKYLLNKTGFKWINEYPLNR